MGTLANCIKKAGKGISSIDAMRLKKAEKTYRQEGLTDQEAANKAISDLISSLDGSYDSLTKKIVAKGGYVEKISYSTVGRSAERKRFSWLSVERESGMPYYQGDGFVLKPVVKLRTRDDFSTHPRALDWGHAIQVEDGMEAWAIDIITKNGTDAGTMAVQIDPATDQIIAIHDIDIHEKGKGLGSKVVKSITANSDKPVKIIEMIDSAWEFWQTMGVEYRDPYSKSGQLEWERLSRSGKTKKTNKGNLQETAAIEDIEENVGEHDLTEEQAPGEEDSWLYRVADESDPFSAPPEDTFLEKTIRYVQNKFLPLKRTQDAISGNGKVISDEMNAYVKEELMHEKAALDLEEVQDKYITKIVDKLAGGEISKEELDLYLYAKHARERNKFIAERNKNIQEGGSGMTDAQAVDILKGFDDSGKTNQLEEAASLVYAMLKDKSNRLNKAGTLSDEQQKSWSDTFEFYVPLKGFQSDNGDTETAYVGKTGKGFNIQGKESMRSLGRRSMSSSPLITAIQDSTAAIMRARKNEVGQSFLKLVRANPNPAYWTIHTQKNPGTREVYNPKTNQVEKVPLSFYDMASNKGVYTGVKIKGQQVFIGMTDKRLAKAMNNMGADTANGVIQMMAKGTRILSSLNTSLNPEFMISNMARDIQTAVMNALAESDIKGGKLQKHLGTNKERLAFAAKMASPKTVMAAMRGINQALKDHKSKGKWQEHWHDFREQGGKTGYFDMKDFEAQANDVEKMIKMAEGGIEGGIRKFSKAVFDFVDRINNSVENAIRLSSYVHGIDAGMTKQQAASLAKNLTVNFNRKGEITWLNAIYMFGNASVQGTAQFLRSVASNPMNHPSGDKFKLSLAQKAGVTMSMAGYVVAMLGREMGGEDDDGEKWIDKVPDYVSERNLVIMKSILGGKEDGSYWTIPLPYGYNIFHNVGTALEAVQNGSKRKDLSWASRYLAFSALGSFSPIGMNTSEKGLDVALTKTATPTLFKPFVEMAVDENFFGSQIYRNSTFDQFTKRDSLGKSNTSEHWKFVSNFLNELTGGTKLKGGFIDIAPESFKHLVNSYAGGLGRLSDNTLGLVGDLAAGNEIEDRKIPFYRKISGKTSKYSNTSDFYDRKDDVYRVHEEMRILKGKDKILFRRENKNYISLYALARVTEKRLRALRKSRKQIEARDHANKKIHLKKIQDRMDLAITRFNRKYNSLFN